MPTLSDLKKKRTSRSKSDAAAPAPISSADLLAAKRAILHDRRDQLVSCASSSINVQAEIQNALAIAEGGPGVLLTSTESFASAVREAVASGLGLSDGYGFLSFDNERCTFVPGWRGLVDLMLRSGRGTVWTGVVRKGDTFDYQLGDRPFCTHRPGDNDDHKSITHYYAIGKVAGSDTPIIEVWSAAKVIRHLNKYNSQGAGHYALKSDEAMEGYGRKIPLLRVLQYMPRSRELNIALAADAANYSSAPTPPQAPAAATEANDEPNTSTAAPAPAPAKAMKKPTAKKPAVKKPSTPRKPAAKKPAPKAPAAGESSFGLE